MSGHMFFFGFGNVARALARRLRADGWRLSGTAREAVGLDRLAVEAVRGHLFNEARPLPPHALAGVSHLLISIPPGDGGDVALEAAGDMIREAAAHLRWVGYLSTVGVYGDHGGAWVDETTPPAPVSERGRRRLMAERQWLALHEETGLPVHIFRLPGIYGPHSSPLKKALAGQSRIVVKEGQVFSRIHLDDLVAALAASIAQPTPGEIYNVTDDAPAPPHEVALFAHELLGLAPPPRVAFAEAELSDMARSFYGESKRVSNAKLKERLGWRPAYPDYKAGLRALKRTLEEAEDDE
ncbi:MAG TPA: SDR family oxidoreductase [Thermopetrobacter sp.]|nr:SDR family oxidoreductase [Thermopetrobacter sp.]